MKCQRVNSVFCGRAPPPHKRPNDLTLHLHLETVFWHQIINRLLSPCIWGGWFHLILAYSPWAMINLRCCLSRKRGEHFKNERILSSRASTNSQNAGCTNTESAARFSQQKRASSCPRSPTGQALFYHATLDTFLRIIIRPRRKKQTLQSVAWLYLHTSHLFTYNFQNKDKKSPQALHKTWPKGKKEPSLLPHCAHGSTGQPPLTCCS